MSVLRNDGRALIVAMDHAQTHGMIDGLQDPGKVLETVINAGADGIMTTLGVVKKHRSLIAGRTPVILRLDGGPSLFREDWLAYTEWELLHSVEDALMLGASAVVVMAFIGIPVELKTIQIVSAVARECMRANLPLVVEALPCQSERIPDAKSPVAMAAAARIAFEHGADLIKTYYTGTPEGFRTVVGNCPVPCLIAGGPRMNTEEETLQVVAGALEAGASGAVFGRNIWQHKNPAGMVKALQRVIHGRASVAEALQELT